jgi:hypothetical protein
MSKNSCQGIISKRMLLVLILLILFLTIMFAPIRLTIAEKRTFTVVDPKGIPIQEAVVRQIWDQYSLHYRNEEVHKSDSNGYVVLPERAIKTSIFDLVSGGIGNILGYTIHASFCSSDSVGVHAEGYEWKWFFDGEKLESGIVVLEKK